MAKNPLTSLTINELIHWWCNDKIRKEHYNKIENYTRGNYIFTEDKMFCNQKLVAVNNKNIFFIRLTFKYPVIKQDITKIIEIITEII